jgi:hypothetical protein
MAEACDVGRRGIELLASFEKKDAAEAWEKLWCILLKLCRE